jgi:hypothetical protein
MMCIVADERHTISNCRQARTRHAPCCSERAQIARHSIMNNTRHPPVRIAAHPALHTKSCKGPDPRLLRFCITRRLLSFGQKEFPKNGTTRASLYQRPDSKHYFAFASHFGTRLWKQQQTKSWERFGIFLSSRQCGSATTKQGAFLLLPFILWNTKKGAHTLPLGIFKTGEVCEV